MKQLKEKNTQRDIINILENRKGSRISKQNNKSNRRKKKYTKRYKLINGGAQALLREAVGPKGNILCMDIGGSGIKTAIYTIDRNLKPILSSSIFNYQIPFPGEGTDMKLLAESTANEIITALKLNKNFHLISLSNSEIKKMFVGWDTSNCDIITESKDEFKRAFIDTLKTRSQPRNCSYFEINDSYAHSLASRAMYGLLFGEDKTSFNIAIGTSPTLYATDSAGNDITLELTKGKYLWNTELNSLLGAGSKTSQDTAVGEIEKLIKEELIKEDTSILALYESVCKPSKGGRFIKYGLANLYSSSDSPVRKGESIRVDEMHFYNISQCFFGKTVWENIIKPIFLTGDKEIFNVWTKAKAPKFISFTGGVSEWKFSGNERLLSTWLNSEQERKAMGGRGGINPVNGQDENYYNTTNIVLGPVNAGLYGAAVFAYLSAMGLMHVI